MEKAEVVVNKNDINKSDINLKIYDGTRLKCIDFIKGLAIIAVVVDHLINILYTNVIVQRLSFFSVTMFVFLGGINTFLSMEKKKTKYYDLTYIYKRISNILIPYSIATAITVYINYRFFDIRIYIDLLFNFSAWAHYYYIVFFIQLIIISPLLFLIIKIIDSKKYKKLNITFIFLILGLISYFCTKYTYVLDVYAAGSMILGGSYLLVFFSGMLIAKYIVKEWTSKQLIFYLLTFGTLLLFFCINWVRDTNSLRSHLKFITTTSYTRRNLGKCCVSR